MANVALAPFLLLAIGVSAMKTVTEHSKGRKNLAHHSVSIALTGQEAAFVNVTSSRHSRRRKVATSGQVATGPMVAAPIQDPAAKLEEIKDSAETAVSKAAEEEKSSVQKVAAGKLLASAVEDEKATRIAYAVAQAKTAKLLAEKSAAEKLANEKQVAMESMEKKVKDAQSAADDATKAKQAAEEIVLKKDGIVQQETKATKDRAQDNLKKSIQAGNDAAQVSAASSDAMKVVDQTGSASAGMGGDVQEGPSVQAGKANGAGP
jgi:hypothetical protein